MEIINMVITSQTGAYLNVKELIEVAKLLGLESPDDIAAVEEAIAREGPVSGDLQLASDLCLGLAKKGHGPIWDLCSAIARSTHVDNMDTSSRKQLLGFALSHFDEESIGELLNAWKDVDMLMHYEQLIISTETYPQNLSVHGSTVVSLPVNSVQDIWSLRDTSELIQDAFKEDEEKTKIHFESLQSILSEVAEEGSTEVGSSWDSLLRENKKVVEFAALELPWLLGLSSKEEYGRKIIPGAKAPPGKHSISIRFQALINILEWLVWNGIAPRDELLISLAKSIMVSPVTEEEDVLGCSFLLNLLDAFHGVTVIEEQLKKRERYQEVYSIMNIGMSYSSIQNSHKEYCSPDQRRGLLLQKFRDKYTAFGSDGKPVSLRDLYSTFMETALSCIIDDFPERRNLHRLLSSLSKADDAHTEDLKKIRSDVWRKLSAFSDNTQLESNIKVYALEIMQCITRQNYKNLPELISEVEPWEDCDEFYQSKIITNTQGADGSSYITSTLVALKSTQLIAAFMPDITITAEDLITVDSAVSCFLNLCEAATSPVNIDALKDVLEEWEVLFSSGIDKEGTNITSSPKEHNEWNDDWDEGWETLPDELIRAEGKEKQSLLIRPLHRCWMKIVKLLITHSRFNDLLHLLDRSSTNGLLLDEDDANSLLHMVVNVDCFMALKVFMLLPHEAPRLLCLQAVESNLKERGPPNISNVDEHEILILVLFSGVLQRIIFNPALQNFFSYMCYLVGQLARICQEDLLKYRDSKTSSPNWCRSSLFCELLLPCFVSELVQAKQCILAGL
ncbi:hypothetical protein KSP39_PZI007962 [Platanthera zijinensis]|uniref:Sec39 domain-containing protein n=1 Tax=Platanthera zijinensis TaxID=2320716 RepID=A0AAP0BPT5_9ASPA